VINAKKKFQTQKLNVNDEGLMLSLKPTCIADLKANNPNL